MKSELDIVLQNIASELAETAKCSMPSLATSETVEREWLADNKYYRAIAKGNKVYYLCYDFELRKLFRAKNIKGSVIIDMDCCICSNASS